MRVANDSSAPSSSQPVTCLSQQVTGQPYSSPVDGPQGCCTVEGRRVRFPGHHLPPPLEVGLARHSPITNGGLGQVTPELAQVLQGLGGDTYCLKAEIPPAGRLGHFLPFWESLTSDAWVLSVVRNGYTLELTRVPPPSGIRRTQARLGSKVLSEEVATLCTKYAVVPVPPDQAGAGYYSTYFLVPKKDGSQRPILNLKQFNHWIVKRHFKMETLESIMEVMTPNLWLASVDLKDAYFHVAIARGSRQYLRFHWKNRAYEYQTLPFGLSSAPWVFTKVLIPVLGWLRKRGVRLHAYLDDILVIGNSHREVTRALILTIQTLVHAGYVLNIKKSDLTPSQDMEYLGCRFVTSQGRAFLPETRRDALIRMIHAFSKAGVYIKARHWLQLLGVMAATIPTVTMARLHMRPVQWYFKGKWSATRHNLFHPVMTTATLHPCLRWWSDPANLSQGKLFQKPPHTLVVTTDASMEGWGGHVKEASGKTLLLSGLWTRTERRLHINTLELRAIYLTLRLLENTVANKSVMVECDNKTAIAYLNKQGGTRSFVLNREARLLHDWAGDNAVSLWAIHRPGVDNVLADYLSRNRPDPLEWCLASRICAKLFMMWGQPQIDLFATHTNHRLNLWFGRYHHPQAAAVNALAQCWTGLSVYAFPPINLIQKSIWKLRTDQVEEAIAILPLWNARPWFPLVLEMACEIPQLLPWDLDLLSQRLPDKGTLFHPDLKRLRLIAWKLTASPGKAQAFRKRLLTSRWQPENSPPGQSIPSDGRPTFVGAIDDTSIPLSFL